MSREPHRASLAAAWHARSQTQRPARRRRRDRARRSPRLFTRYLRAARADEHALSMLPPGRFLMPGDLEGSPALTFAPLDVARDFAAAPETLAAMMERRYEAYRTHVVRPFFRDHFARLDRQIVLVDMLAALNAGPAALRDLEAALADVLAAFRPGRASWLTAIVRRRIDRILFAATKADHVHHTDHDNLAKLLARLTRRAAERAAFAGAEIRIVPLAAVRATREATVKRGGERLPAIAGVPMQGERVAGELYDGETEVALFPGDLPADPESIFEAGSTAEERALAAEAEALRFLRFRPPQLERTAEGLTLSLPHIRLDQTLQYPDRGQAPMNAARQRSRRPGAFRLDDPAVEAVDETIERSSLSRPTPTRPSRRSPSRAAAASTGAPSRSLPAARSFRSASASPSTRWCATSSPAPTGWAGSASRWRAVHARRPRLVGRELAGLFRLKRLARLRLAGDDAAARNDRDAAIAVVRSLTSLYESRPETARGRRALPGT